MDFLEITALVKASKAWQRAWYASIALADGDAAAARCAAVPDLPQVQSIALTHIELHTLTFDSIAHLGVGPQKQPALELTSDTVNCPLRPYSVARAAAWRGRYCVHFSTRGWQQATGDGAAAGRARGVGRCSLGCQVTPVALLTSQAMPHVNCTRSLSLLLSLRLLAMRVASGKLAWELRQERL